MIVYDNHLGWKITPDWNVRHKLYDFDVSCSTNFYGFAIVLIPGRPFAEKPYSVSALFMEYLRKKIVKNSKDMKVDVVDLAKHLRERYQRYPGKWFYPKRTSNTGRGHRNVYDILSPRLQ